MKRLFVAALAIVLPALALGQSVLRPPSGANTGVIYLTDFGAVSDAKYGRDTITAATNSPVVTFTAYSFAPTDVGKSIFISGIGASGGNFTGTIATYNSTHSISLNTNPGTAVTTAVEEVDYGTDNLPAFTAASAALHTLVGNYVFNDQSVKFECGNGKYYVSGPLNFTGLGHPSGGNHVTIEGGCTIVGTGVNGVILDALGTQEATFRDFTIYAGIKAGNASIGLQVGRFGLAGTTNLGSQGLYNNYDSVVIYGYFSKSAYYNFAAEDNGCFNSTFSNENATNGTYGGIYDGYNHWNAQSTFQTQVNAVDTQVSFDNNIGGMNCHYVSVGTGALWIGNVRGLHFTQGYDLVDTANVSHGIVLYTGTTGNIQGLTLDNFHQELSTALSENFYITATASTANATASFALHDATAAIDSCPVGLTVGQGIYDKTSSAIIGTVSTCPAGTQTLTFQGTGASAASSGAADALSFPISPTITGFSYHDSSNQAINQIIASDPVNVYKTTFQDFTIKIESFGGGVTPMMFDNSQNYTMRDFNIQVPQSAGILFPTLPTAVGGGIFCITTSENCMFILPRIGAPTSAFQSALYYDTAAGCVTHINTSAIRNALGCNITELEATTTPIQTAGAGWLSTDTTITVDACPSDVAVGAPVIDQTTKKWIGTFASCAVTTLTLQAASLSAGSLNDKVGFPLTLTTNQNGQTFSNGGATGEVDLVLPVASDMYSYCFTNNAAAGVPFAIYAPGPSGKFASGAAVGVVGGSVNSSTGVGKYPEICVESHNITNIWNYRSSTGTWTLT
jgi:hypothetical protein